MICVFHCGVAGTYGVCACRVLKDDNKSLKQDITDSRQGCSKLRQELLQLNRKFEDAKDKKLQAEFDAKDFIKEVETARAHSVEEREVINTLRHVTSWM